MREVAWLATPIRIDDLRALLAFLPEAGTVNTDDIGTLVIEFPDSNDN